MSTKEFLYRYKDVEISETKTFLQKNAKIHEKDLNIAVEDIFKSEDHITIVTSDWKDVKFNKSLLILFSRTMRNCFASLSCCTEPTIFLPDTSADTVNKVHDILEKQFTNVEGNSFRDIQTVVEAANALGIDVDNLDFRNPAYTAATRNLSDTSEELEPENTIKISKAKRDIRGGKLVDLKLLHSNAIAEWSGSDDSSDSEESNTSLHQAEDGESSSDGEVQDDENESKTVSESVSANKKSVIDGTIIDETITYSEVEEESSEENDMPVKDFGERDLSDNANAHANGNTNVKSSNSPNLEEHIEDSMNMSTSSVVIDKVLSCNEEILQTERSSLGEEAAVVPSENILAVNHTLEYMKGVKSIIEKKLDDLRGSIGSQESVNIAENVAGSEDAADEGDLIKDEIKIPIKKELKKELPMPESNEYENRFRCTLCYNIMRKLAVSTFKEHYSTAHFHKEIFEMYIGNSAETICKVDGCGKEFDAKNKGNLVRHIGSTHNKAVEILQLKGLDVPLVLAESNLSNKRKRSEIKAEKVRKVKMEVTEEAFECLMCGSFYSSKSNLEKHLMKFHK